MNEMKKDLNQLVDVFNDYTSTVFYKHNNIYRSWDRPGAVKKIPLHELYEVANTKGGRILFYENMLLVKDSKAREYIGLEPLNEFNPISEEIKEIVKNGTQEQLEKILKYCSDTTLEKLIKIAIDLPIQSVSKASLIQDYSGTDILGIIQEKKEMAKESSSQAKQEEVAPETNKPIRRKKVIDS